MMGDLTLADSMGFLATFLFSIVYFPQMVLNFKRKDTTGFSAKSMIIKLIGGAFLGVNAHYSGERLPVVLYGCIGLFQYSLLLAQIGIYNDKKYLFLWFLFPLIPYSLTFIPGTVAITNTFKPITQITSHVTQLLEFWKLQSTEGYSLTSQHYNWIGGWAGMYMCYVNSPPSTSTWFLYINSLIQAGTVFLAVIYFDGVHKFMLKSAFTSWLVSGGSETKTVHHSHHGRVKKLD